ncbi:MAG: adenylate/guanylate cyclase domain-containing protein [Verrucomicrobiae bacterium]|nr:adenylate/guanylate cyclase domain-containing protein [Verrucomicrobiae bacterium]
MSPPAQDADPTGSGRGFDPVQSPWFFPLIVLAALLSLRFLAPAVVEKAELFWLDLALDLRARSGHSSPLDPSIRFVELKMNEEIARRFATEGEYATVAGVLETLAALETRVIAVDIIYTYGRAEDQKLLAEAIERIHANTRTRVVLSTSIEKNASPPHLLTSLPHAGGEKFEQGIVNVPADRHWREYQLVYRFEGKTLPSLALATYAASRPPALAPQIVAEGVMEWKTLDDSGSPVTRRGDTSRLFLNLPHSYFDNRYDKTLPGFEKGGRVWTVAEIERLAARAGNDSPLRDTLVFLGYDAEVDGKPTTHSPLEPGMFLHGTALHDLMHDTSIRPAPPWLDYTLHLLSAILAAFAFSQVKGKRSLLLVATAGIVLTLAFGWIAIWHRGLLLLPAAVSAASLWGASVFLEIGRRWTWEQRERTRRDAMLGFYFSPAVLKLVTQNLDMIRPRGGEVAVLLSDLRAFTTLCESGEVERVFELLNRLFAVETDAALRENGSLARFAGDQFLAYWGAPEPCADAPDRALRAALEIERTLRSRRESPSADEIDGWLRIGIGLHCGRGLTGHVGSRTYRDYNIVGDCVNTTARIEGQTKNYAAAILASGEFMAALREKPLSLHLDRVQVKGRSLATELHAVFGTDNDPGAEGREAYTSAFRLYESGDFAGAAEAFDRLAPHPHPTIATSAELLADRCRRYLEDPPDHWDGVHELTSK